jgi:folate-dependent tRNA-U54 methylase TrmFO/GidA
MSTEPFEYAVITVVPRVERGESINAGVILYSHRHRYLDCRVQLDAGRLRALDPAADPGAVTAALAVIEETCRAARPATEAARDRSGEAAAPATQSLGARFRWLTAPRSTIVQPGPVHSGLTADPAAELEHLFDKLVR